MAETSIVYGGNEQGDNQTTFIVGKPAMVYIDTEGTPHRLDLPGSANMTSRERAIALALIDVASGELSAPNDLLAIPDWSTS